MKRISVLILLVLFTLNHFYAQPAQQITESQARQTALAFVNANQKLQNAELELVSASKIFIYNVGNQGFVIISGSTVLPPVLAYSDEGTFVADDMPEHIASWLAHYGEMLDFAEANHIQPEAAILRQWDEASKGVFGAKEAKTVDPLLSTRWNQDCHYNAYCPVANGPCGHTYAGCVATALAQVLKYWSYPEQGWGMHSYIHSDYGEQSANFGYTTYRWDEMPDQVYDDNDAVATLLYHCAVAVNMDFGPSSSGAAATSATNAMRRYFGYCEATYKNKADFTDDEWIALLKAELDLSRPLYYAGRDEYGNGHVFVCDGYDNNDRFHFNFGWSGFDNAFYSIYDVNGYDRVQGTIVNAYPYDIQADGNGIIYVAPDGEGNGSSWENATGKLDIASGVSSGNNIRVWVKKGTYYGDGIDEENAFYIMENNRVYGSFNGDEGPDYDLSQRDFVNNATIIDGQGLRRALCQEMSFDADLGAIWDGFTLQNGAAGSGAGAYLNNCGTLANCRIINNAATMFGGGVYINSGGSTPNSDLIRCTITGNSAAMGGGICDRLGATYDGCIVSNNTGTAKGGGLYLYNNTSASFANCVFGNNTCKEAAAIYARGSVTAYNCDFVMNLATESSGAIFNELTHNKYYNCILWGNLANGQPNQSNGSADFEYCAVQGDINGTGNIALPAENDGEEPGVFVRFAQLPDGAGVDFQNERWALQPNSICLNAGKPNTTGAGDTDIEGNPRIQKGRIEIGAYESCASLTSIEKHLYESSLPYSFFGRELTESGYYTAVLNGYDCDSVIGLTLMVLEGVEEGDPSTGSGAFVVWPNPTNGLIHIDMESDFVVEIRNVLGQLMMQAENATTLSLDLFEKGVYFLIVKNNEGLEAVAKVIKE